jgi:hypothetical protein
MRGMALLSDDVSNVRRKTAENVDQKIHKQLFEFGSTAEPLSHRRKPSLTMLSPNISPSGSSVSILDSLNPLPPRAVEQPAAAPMVKLMGGGSAPARPVAVPSARTETKSSYNPFDNIVIQPPIQYASLIYYRLTPTVRPF